MLNLLTFRAKSLKTPVFIPDEQNEQNEQIEQNESKVMHRAPAIRHGVTIQRMDNGTTRKIIMLHIL